MSLDNFNFSALDRERYNALDAATKDALWRTPDWTCPKCGTVNMAVRSQCRNMACLADVEEVLGGEIRVFEAIPLRLP